MTMATDDTTHDDEQARHALNRLRDLDQKRITPGRTARYAGIGAAAATGANLLADTIGGTTPRPGEAKGPYLRRLAGKAVAGAAVTGGVPLLHQHLDRAGELSTIHHYLKSRAVPNEQTKRAGVDDVNTQAIESELQMIKRANLAKSANVSSDFDLLIDSMADEMLKQAALSLAQLKKPLPFGVGKLNPSSQPPIGILTKMRQHADPTSRSLEKILGGGSRLHAAV